MPSEQYTIPEKFLPFISPVSEPLLFDSYCGEPVSWGKRIIRHLGEDLFDELRRECPVECIDVGEWFIVDKTLNRQEAIEKYGPITNEELGPRGGFRSVTFGNKKFISRKVSR